MLKRKTPLRSGGLKPSGLAPGGLKSGGLKQSGIKRQGGIKRANNGNKNQFAEDLAFYAGIWEKRPHVCQVCGKHLGSEMSVFFMDHGLEKSVYPELRHEEENIIIVCIDHHVVKTNGFPHPIHKELIEKIKIKFNK